MRRLLGFGVLCAALLVVAAGASSCRCSEDNGEEARLRKTVDAAPVHLYVGAKNAVARGASDAELEAIRRFVVDYVAADRKGGAAPPPRLSLGQLASAAKALVRMRADGAAIVRSDDEAGAVPLLPQILPGDASIAGVTTNGEHALFLVVLFALKVYPESPAPVPEEILLYEAWRTKPDALALPGAAEVTHAIRAVVFGSNDFCDLAAADAEHLAEGAYDSRELASVLALLPARPGGEGALSDAATVGRIASVLEGLAEGSVAICYSKRGDGERTGAATRRFVDAIRRTGTDSDELVLLSAFASCAEGEGEAGAAELARFAQRPGAAARAAEIAALTEYCRRTEGDPSAVFRKLNLAALALQVGALEIQRTGLHERAEELSAYRAIRAVERAVSTLLAAKDVAGAVQGLGGAARGLLD